MRNYIGIRHYWLLCALSVLGGCAHHKMRTDETPWATVHHSANIKVAFDEANQRVLVSNTALDWLVIIWPPLNTTEPMTMTFQFDKNKKSAAISVCSLHFPCTVDESKLSECSGTVYSYDEHNAEVTPKYVLPSSMMLYVTPAFSETTEFTVNFPFLRKEPVPWATEHPSKKDQRLPEPLINAISTESVCR